MTGKWIAFNLVGGCVEDTKRLLFKPFKLGFWLKLALVVFLIGGGMNSVSNNRFYEFDEADFGGGNLLLIIGLFIVVFAIILFFSYIGSVALFVFYDSVLTGKVEFFDGFHEHLGKGLRLFLFNILVGAIATILFILIFLPPIGLFLVASGTTVLLGLLVYALIGFPLFIVWIVFFSIVSTFTKDFVVPLMIKKKRGVLASWETLITIIKKNMGQFIIYVISRIMLGIVTGIISLIILAVVMLFILLVAFILGFGFATILSPSLPDFTESALVIILGILALLAFIILLGYFLTLITLPFPVFFRLYSLLFLEKVSPKLSFFKKKKKEKSDEEDDDKKESEEDIYVEVK